MNTIELLNQLADMQAQRDLMLMNLAELRNQIIPAEVQQKLADLEMEWATPMATVDAQIAALNDQVKQAVLYDGNSAKGTYLHAVFSQRKNWDNDKLEGFALAHPEILQARRITPSVTIRPVK